jgi:type II secretory pathway pseudopilin PulG
MEYLNNRRAFTMMELIFILVIIGILAAVIIPKSRDTRLREAADQIVSHIRYTQHLAMMNDVFDPNDNEWYKERWQIFFEQDSDLWSYTIFSDADKDGAIDETEIAINPQDSSKRLTGIASGAILDTVITKGLNIGKTYGIKGANGIEFANCNDDGSLTIAFDYLGRPMSRNPSTYTMSYHEDYLIAAPCTITIKENSGGSINITIQPETGFAKIE